MREQYPYNGRTLSIAHLFKYTETTDIKMFISLYFKPVLLRMFNGRNMTRVA